MLSMGELVELHGCTVTWSLAEGFKLLNAAGFLIPTKVINRVPQLQTAADLAKSGSTRVALPAAPAKPKAASDAPAQPAKPAQPAQPAQPAKPAQPAQPAQPDQPAQPADSQAKPASLHEPQVSDSDEEGQEGDNPPSAHFLTHMPKHKGCEVCRQAKQKRKQARRATGPRTADRAKVFGDLIHTDHLVSLSCPGVDGSTRALLAKDQATKLATSVPVLNKTAELAVDAIANFIDNTQTVSLRSDNSKELVAAGLLLRQFFTVSFQTRVQHRPQSHAIMERWGQEVIVGVRCLLLQAGVPECFWSLAISYWTLCYNVSSN